MIRRDGRPVRIRRRDRVAPHARVHRPQPAEGVHRPPRASRATTTCSAARWPSPSGSGPPCSTTSTSSSTSPTPTVLDTSRGHPLGPLVRRRPAEHRPQLPRQVDRHADRTARRPSDGRARKARRARSPTASCRATSTSAPPACARSALGKGDRVALFMPMCPELITAFFAVIKIGGIVLPLFSGYGADAVADAAARCGSQRARHRRRILAARPAGRDEAGRRRGRRRGARPCDT